MNKLGLCSKCLKDLSPVWFEEIEYDKYHRQTGRKRMAISHLLCEYCGHTECIDDSFDAQWHY